LNRQKYSELPLYPLTDPEDALWFLSDNNQQVSLEEVKNRIVRTGGRFQYLLQNIIYCKIFDYNHSDPEWAIWSHFLRHNENLLSQVVSDESNLSLLLNMISIGRDILQDLLDAHQFKCVVDDFVDKDILVPEPGKQHYFLPAWIYCVYQLWKYELV
jgi:hypothetical protein